MKTFSYEIECDGDAGNPRDEFDRVSTFYAVKNSRYITGGKNDVEVYDQEDLENEIKTLSKDGAVIVECHNNQTGTFYAVINVDTLKREYIAHGYSMRKAKYWARRCAMGEAEEFNTWANGDVYGYTITDDETGETVDSCLGFYGYEFCDEEAQSQIKWLEEHAREEDAEILRRLELATTL